LIVEEEGDKMHQSKISNLMATFKNFKEAYDPVDIGDTFEKEFLEIFHLF